MKKYINLSVFIVFIILVIWISLLRYQVKKLRAIEPTVTIVRDTIRDTLKTFSPVPILVEFTETILLPVDSLVIVNNNIILPKERKTYQDSTYKAVVSGYRPNLDYIEVYQKTITNTITKTVRPSRWGIGISAGYGVNFSDKLRPGPYIGVGVYYNIYNLKR